MSYSPNSLNLLIPRVGGGDDLTSESSAVWSYRETGDAILAVMVADDYITDGDEQGVKVGDAILFTETAVDAAWGTVDTVTAGLVGIILMSNP